MDIHVFQEQSHLSISSPSVIALVLDFMDHAKVTYDEVSIYFVDTQTISEMHGEYFDDPTTTDCISFPMDLPDAEGYRVMGDVFVCPETASDFIAKNGGDCYEEITLYVIHGLLHLLGYDDIEEEDRLEMRKAETDYLTRVAKKKLWLISEK